MNSAPRAGIHRDAARLAQIFLAKAPGQHANHFDASPGRGNRVIRRVADDYGLVGPATELLQRGQEDIRVGLGITDIVPSRC